MGICSSRKFFLRTHTNVCQDDKRKCLCDSGSIKRTCQQCSFFLNVDHGRFLWIPHRSYFFQTGQKDHFGISAFLAVHLVLAMLSPNWLWLSLNPAKSEGPIPSAIRRTLPGFFTRTSSFTCNSFKNIMMNSGGDGNDETWMVVAICWYWIFFTPKASTKIYKASSTKQQPTFSMWLFIWLYGSTCPNFHSPHSRSSAMGCTGLFGPKELVVLRQSSCQTLSMGSSI